MLHTAHETPADCSGESRFWFFVGGDDDTDAILDHRKIFDLVVLCYGLAEREPSRL